MKLTGAEILIGLLEREGISTISGIPGGANLPMYDALKKSKIRHILARHEQGAGFIAQGMARTDGKPAVCFATSGPGATNLLTAIADAKLDSIPIIAVTGQVPSSMIGTDAFQEVDTYGMSLPVTKHNFFIRKAEELFEIVPEAFRIAGSGRPGPVLIDMPKDVQKEIFEFSDWPATSQPEPIPEFDETRLQEIADAIHNAKHPILYIGGGVTYSHSADAVLELAKSNDIPVTATLMGLGSFPPEDPLYLGMPGMHGARFTNMLLHKTDLLLAFGVRFDDRATGQVSSFCPDAKIIHIDIDHSELGKIKQAEIGLAADIKDALTKLLPLIKPKKRPDWIKEINQLKDEFPLPQPEHDDVFHPIGLIKALSTMAGDDTIIATDVGQHQMWAAQYFAFKRPRSLLTSGGLGTMGFGLPAAIGAALERPDATVYCITGDGSLLMNIQELATLADSKLNVKIILMNNNHLGLVRQQQELFYKKEYYAVEFESQPKFCQIAEGFGIPAIDLENDDSAEKTLQEAISKKGPVLINIPIEAEENVLPIVPPGAANKDMIGG